MVAKVVREARMVREAKEGLEAKEDPLIPGRHLTHHLPLILRAIPHIQQIPLIILIEEASMAKMACQGKMAMLIL